MNNNIHFSVDGGISKAQSHFLTDLLQKRSVLNLKLKYVRPMKKYFSSDIRTDFFQILADIKIDVLPSK